MALRIVIYFGNAIDIDGSNTYLFCTKLKNEEKQINLECDWDNFFHKFLMILSTIIAHNKALHTCRKNYFVMYNVC